MGWISIGALSNRSTMRPRRLAFRILEVVVGAEVAAAVVVTVVVTAVAFAVVVVFHGTILCLQMFIEKA